MKKVLIYAYTKHNFGDDLLIRILCGRYPEVKFFLYTYPDYPKNLSSCNNLRIISNATIISKLVNVIGRKFFHKGNYFENLLAKTCDATVCVTGSLFIQSGENWKPYIEYMKSRQIKEKPYYQLGSNFGPYTDPMFYEEFKVFFANCKDVCFRESYSYDLFSELDNVRWAPDIGFTENYDRFIHPNEKRIAVSVIDLAVRNDLHNYQEFYYDFLTRVCEDYIEKGYIIDLLSFCAFEGDENAVKELSGRLPANRIEKHLYFTDTSMEEMLDLFGRSEVILATRFHAMIVGWCMGKRVLPIIYSDKTKHVLSDIGVKEGFVDIKDLKSNSEHVNVEQQIELRWLSEYSNKQFEELDRLLAPNNSL